MVPERDDGLVCMLLEKNETFQAQSSALGFRETIRPPEKGRFFLQSI